jgi:hypothetical protein
MHTPCKRKLSGFQSHSVVCQRSVLPSAKGEECTSSCCCGRQRSLTGAKYPTVNAANNAAPKLKKLAHSREADIEPTAHKKADVMPAMTPSRAPSRGCGSCKNPTVAIDNVMKNVPMVAQISLASIDRGFSGRCSRCRCPRIWIYRYAVWRELFQQYRKSEEGMKTAISEKCHRPLS